MSDYSMPIDAPSTLLTEIPGLTFRDCPEGQCPTQAAGHLHGVGWYFRARSGVWRLSLGRLVDGYVSHDDEQWATGGIDSTYGYMSQDQALWCIGVALGAYLDASRTS